jgi:hypothetical protein
MSPNNNTAASRWHGRNAISLLRCSTADQVETSIPAQRDVSVAFARANGISIIREIELDGVSGSKPAIRKDIDTVIALKEEGLPFDILLVYDNSRLTRGGPDHVGWIRQELRNCGVELVYSADNNIEGEMAPIFASVSAMSSLKYCKDLSKSVTRGTQLSIEEGRTAYCKIPPYGTAFLFIQPDGQPRCMLFYNPDGSQTVRDPESGKILQQYPPKKKKQRDRRYAKQPRDHTSIVPGEEHACQVVAEIYRAYHLEGLGCNRIARRLHERGVKTPRDKTWTKELVRAILRNTIYTGRGACNRRSRAIFFSRSATEIGKNKAVPDNKVGGSTPEYRPIEEWTIVDEPAMQDYLPEDVRDLAKAHHDKILTDDAYSIPQKRRHKHDQSPYVLRGLLKTKDGFNMTGKTAGSPPRRVYYIPKVANSVDKSLRRKRATIRADQIEPMIHDIVVEAIAMAPKLQDYARASYADLSAARQQDSEQVDDLRQQLDDLRLEARMTVKNAVLIGEAESQRILDELTPRITALEARIKDAEQQSVMSPEEIEGKLSQALDRLQSRAKDLSPASHAALRQVYGLLIASLTIDMDTLDIEMELSLPQWALSAPEGLGVKRDPASRTNPDAQPRLVLQRVALDYQRPGHWIAREMDRKAG